MFSSPQDSKAKPQDSKTSDRGLNTARKMLAEGKRDSGACLILARHYRVQGNLKQAIQYYENALLYETDNRSRKEDPDFCAMVCFENASCYDKSLNHEAHKYLNAAILYLERLADPAPERFAEVYEARGTVYLDNDNLEPSIGNFIQALVLLNPKVNLQDPELPEQLHPQSIGILIKCGIAYCKQYNLNRNEYALRSAVKFLTRALKMDDKNAVAHYQLARLYHQQKNYVQAIHHYTRAIELKPEAPDKLYDELLQVFLNFQMSGNFTVAVAKAFSNETQKVLRTHTKLHEEMRRRDLRSVCELLVKADVIPNTQSDGKDHSPTSTHDANNLIAMTNQFKREPNDFNLCFKIAKICADRGSYDTALHYYGQGSRLIEDFREKRQVKTVTGSPEAVHLAEIYGDAGNACFNLGSFALAVGYFTRALRLFNGTPREQLNAILAKKFTLHPKSADCLYKRGLAYCTLYEMAPTTERTSEKTKRMCFDAVEDLQNFLTFAPNHVDANRWLGRLYYYMNSDALQGSLDFQQNYISALKYFSQAVKLQPTNKALSAEFNHVYQKAFQEGLKHPPSADLKDDLLRFVMDPTQWSHDPKKSVFGVPSYNAMQSAKKMVLARISEFKEEVLQIEALCQALAHGTVLANLFYTQDGLFTRPTVENDEFLKQIVSLLAQKLKSSEDLKILKKETCDALTADVDLQKKLYECNTYLYCTLMDAGVFPSLPHPTRAIALQKTSTISDAKDAAPATNSVEEVNQASALVRTIRDREREIDVDPDRPTLSEEIRHRINESLGNVMITNNML